MNIWYNIDDFKPIQNPVVTIGTFDGVHLGHQKIIASLNTIANAENGESIVLTFIPHPRIVVSQNPDEVKLLNTIPEKIEILEKLGVQNIVFIPFTSEFAKQPHSAFLHEIVIGKLKAKYIIIGFNHRFGHERKGSYDFLEENQHKFGYQTIEIPPFEYNGVEVSSTKIRKALEEGNVQKANSYLGYEYSVSGIVKKGIGLGRQLGFPTANISEIDIEKLIPADGVYVVKIALENESFYGMLNIGNNPTIINKGRSVEVNIFDFNKDIYNKGIRISFLTKLRNEKKFDHIDFLKDQIMLDELESRKFLQLYLK